MSVSTSKGMFSTMVRGALSRAHRAAAMAESAHRGVTCEVWIESGRALALADPNDLPRIEVLVEVFGFDGTLVQLSATSTVGSMASKLIAAAAPMAEAAVAEEKAARSRSLKMSGRPGPGAA